MLAVGGSTQGASDGFGNRLADLLQLYWVVVVAETSPEGPEGSSLGDVVAAW